MGFAHTLSGSSRNRSTSRLYCHTVATDRVQKIQRKDWVYIVVLISVAVGSVGAVAVGTVVVVGSDEAVAVGTVVVVVVVGSVDVGAVDTVGA